MKNKWIRYEYRRSRTRRRVRGAQGERPRLCVHRSLTAIYAQVIDDAKGATVAAASSFSPEIAQKGKAAKNVESAKRVGELVAKKALAAGVKKVVFDRGAYLYHGRIKALAEAARTGGLEF
ncbi:MAG: 50S ribosomal protein L18 [Elusimicrobia bacterium]|nr:50S ribosomal protein L18 [Elusimicrobiota bacterium]MDE2312617.1 50S ribosomal protein L18 [Elusimicrobiota bacterium]